MESKIAELIETDNRMVVKRGWPMGKWGYTGQRVQATNFRMNNFWGSNIQHVDYN